MEARVSADRNITVFCLHNLGAAGVTNARGMCCRVGVGWAIRSDRDVGVCCRPEDPGRRLLKV